MRATCLLILFALTSTSGCGGELDGQSFNSETPSGASVEVLSTGFEAEIDGVTFENHSPAARLDVLDGIALFGRAAICGSTSGDCTPVPEAREWLDVISEASAGGVCEGIALLMAGRHVEALAPNTASLVLDKQMERTLLRLQATQYVNSVAFTSLNNRQLSLAQLINDVNAELQEGRPVTIGLYTTYGGHTVLAVRSERVSEDVWTITVIDPNWPLQERQLIINLGKNSWRYSFFSEDENNDPDPWFGSAKGIDFLTIADRSQSGEPLLVAGNSMTVTITARGDSWELKTEDGAVFNAASTDSSLVTTIIRGSFGKTTTILRLPVGEDFVVNTNTGRAREETSISLTMPNRSARFSIAGDSELKVSNNSTLDVAVSGTVASHVSTTPLGRIIFDGDLQRVSLSENQLQILPASRDEPVSFGFAGLESNDAQLSLGPSTDQDRLILRPVTTIPQSALPIAAIGVSSFLSPPVNGLTDGEVGASEGTTSTVPVTTSTVPVTTSTVPVPLSITSVASGIGDMPLPTECATQVWVTVEIIGPEGTEIDMDVTWSTSSESGYGDAVKGVNPGSHRLLVGIFDYTFRGVEVVAIVNASSVGQTSVTATLVLKGESGGGDCPSVFG